METIHYISAQPISLKVVSQIISSNKTIALSEESVLKIEKCRAFLNDKMKTHKDPIYGINTGFGSLYNVKINSENLSKNCIPNL